MQRKTVRLCLRLPAVTLAAEPERLQRDGTQRFLAARKDSPVFPELKAFLAKTSGIPAVIREVLAGVASTPSNCFEYLPHTQDLSGGPNPYSPKWPIDGTIDYDFDVDGSGTLIPRVTYSYTTGQYRR